MVDSPQQIASDIEAISRIEAVPTLLQVLCDITGMGFAAVARVTEHTWTACAVQDVVNFGLKPIVDLDTWLGLAREGISRFPANAELYIRPMYWPQNGVGGGVLFDAETTDWCLCIYHAPMPQPVGSALTPCCNA